jgi:glycosyltransferase involved in cell wall biosynthesis
MKYERLKDKTLAIFFTAGVSLKTWHDIGMIDREVAIYNKLSKHFRQIYFFTYGGNDDLKFQHYLADNITIIPSRYVSNFLLYSLLLPFIHRRILKNIDILKTNQMLGSWSAFMAKLLYRKKLAVRTGYTWSILYSKENPKSRKILVVKNIEKLIYRTCDAAITSSEGDFSYVDHNYHPRCHTLIRNYVETEVFKPLDRTKQKGSICYIGRLQGIKNLTALLEALKGLPYTLDIIGSGQQEEELKRFAINSKVKANFLGNIPNHELPEILSAHELFVLPSLLEGMPKTLLEAMACGLPVIGTNVEGIKEVIKHGENGILCDTDSGSIRKAITSVMEDEGLRKKLGKNARRTIEKGFSLEKLVEKELELYANLYT